MTNSIFIVVSIATKEISSKTKEFLLNDKADYMACGRCDGGLFFTKDTIELIHSELVDSNVLQEVYADVCMMITILHDKRASMLFLN